MQPQYRILALRVCIASLILVGAAFLLAPLTQLPPQAPSPSPTILPVVYPSGEHAQVTRVVDGDTIRVTVAGTERVVRLIGVNAPESVAPGKPVECYGTEAARYTAAILGDQAVTLTSDESQQDQDRYGRLLRYVFLSGQLFNQQLIKEGYALEYTYDRPYALQQQFKQAQEEAKQAGLGLWAACAATPDPFIEPAATE